ncbi:murein L,D-transpeptidase [Aestuariibius sp. HNIBRBA575]|uniref:L,D-transpeptidase family protein n=1 Tax=Aestuariibius sp. HNIBRBA575 TaxID=3233343 RepID=UPI0034A186CA
MIATVFSAPQAQAQVTAFKQAVAEAAARDDDLAAFYRAREFEGIWTGNRDRSRRNALLTALSDAGNHGLPVGRYDPETLRAQVAAAQTPEQLGQLEVELSRVFLQYATDIQTGVLIPRQVVNEIRREVPYRNRLAVLQGFAQSSPTGFLRSLPPSSPEYNRLLRAKLQMEQQLGQGGFGPEVSGTLAPGASGEQVINLRNRLITMGFMERNATQTYDASVQAGVQRFQQAMGLNHDGVVGEGTLRELNRSMGERLQGVIVAMERERWINRPRGDRHVWVNLTDFTARIVDNGAVTFQTRSVIGARDSDRQSPEFSDVMEFMVINPSWYVPRSIIVNEYLPRLRANSHAVSHLEITDSRGRVVNRGAVNFAQYNERTFPYSMRQPPSRGNALGLVKFMFPNQHNIYLHDTPAQNLFSREVRAFSHGCIRLDDPFDFAYALLAKQTSDPRGFFHSRLDTGRETRVDLDQPVPVHIIYRTAFTSVDGTMNYRRDIYNRDSRIWSALSREGVAVRSVGG